MPKKIKTLVSDIYAFLKKPDASVMRANIPKFAEMLSERIYQSLEREHTASLRMSNLGTPCNRKLWYTINKPELAEKLSGKTRMKFLFGDIIEELVLFLAKCAGHSVTDEQKTVNLHGVSGHIDGRVDGRLVDVKSSSTYGMAKFRDGTLRSDDPFGYLVQLSGYAAAESVDTVGFISIDKTLGDIEYNEYDATGIDFERMIAEKRAMLANPEPPPRAYADEADGKSGNRKLGMACSYCQFKSDCWSGLTAWRYSRGPVYLTRVVREPDVERIVDENVR